MGRWNTWLLVISQAGDCLLPVATCQWWQVRQWAFESLKFCHTSHTITNNLLQAVLGVIVGALQLPVQLLHLRPRLDGGWQSLLDMWLNNLDAGYEANLANVLCDPIEGEAGLVRHNVEVLTDSLTGDQQNDNDVDDNEDQTFIWKCNDGNISQNWRYDKPGLLDTVFQLTIRTRKDGGGKNRFSVVGCKII